MGDEIALNPAVMASDVARSKRRPRGSRAEDAVRGYGGPLLVVCARVRAFFDPTLPLEQVAEGYRAMDERRAIKTLPMP